MYNLNGLLSKTIKISRIYLFYNYLLRQTDEQPSTTENDTLKITLNDLKKLSRKFSIDLTPKVSTKDHRRSRGRVELEIQFCIISIYFEFVARVNRHAERGRRSIYLNK
jgi:hypothetical protein